MFNDWFTIYVLEEFTNGLEKAVFTERNQSIKLSESYSGTRNTCNGVLTVFSERDRIPSGEKVTHCVYSDQIAIFVKMNFLNKTENDLNASKISKVYVRANYEKDRNLQECFSLVKKKQDIS